MPLFALLDHYSWTSGVGQNFLENFLGEEGGVAKIWTFRGHLSSSGHHKNSGGGGLRPPSEL